MVSGVAVFTFLCVWNASKSKIILYRVTVFDNLIIFVFVGGGKKKTDFKKS